MVITNEDRYAVLERKLMEAESALFGCRQILNHILRESGTEDTTGGRDSRIDRTASGLYPGQYPAPTADRPDTEDECIE